MQAAAAGQTATARPRPGAEARSHGARSLTVCVPPSMHQRALPSSLRGPCRLRYCWSSTAALRSRRRRPVVGCAGATAPGSTQQPRCAVRHTVCCATRTALLWWSTWLAMAPHALPVWHGAPSSPEVRTRAGPHAGHGRTRSCTYPACKLMLQRAAQASALRCSCCICKVPASMVRPPISSLPLTVPAHQQVSGGACKLARWPRTTGCRTRLRRQAAKGAQAARLHMRMAAIGGLHAVCPCTVLPQRHLRAGTLWRDAPG